MHHFILKIHHFKNFRSMGYYLRDDEIGYGWIVDLQNKIGVRVFERFPCLYSSVYS